MSGSEGNAWRLPACTFVLAVALSWMAGPGMARTVRAAKDSTGQDKTCCEVVTGPPNL